MISIFEISLWLTFSNDVMISDAHSALASINPLRIKDHLKSRTCLQFIIKVFYQSLSNSVIVVCTFMATLQKQIANI